MRKNTPFQTLLPLTVAVSIIGGMFIYKLMFGDRMLIGNQDLKFDKMSALLRNIEGRYVDSVSYDSLVEKAIPTIIEQLDPHSAYMTAAERKRSEESLRGNFDGIGVMFNLRNDTVYVIEAIAGGPSEKVGIRGGDRIIKVNDTIVAGVDITNEKIMSKLKGVKGTKVKVTVKRLGIDKEIDFEIIRNKIPIHSIDVSYLIKDNIGYIKITRFSLNTYREFMEKVAELKQQGMRKIIIDLRENGGGIMQDAIRIADEFLSAGKIIVYTEGHTHPRANYYSSAHGFLQNDDVVILIDEWSSSASEILAGAIQDNDRGTIVGRRSFGKGLVQEPIYFEDGSELRLTVARYYTPTGRSIQKPYDNDEDYELDMLKRYERGEFTSSDSIKHNDSLKFVTPKGKVVYGGGGIMPDIFVPADTTGGSRFFSEVRKRGLDFQFSYDYADANRNTLTSFKDTKKLEEHLETEGIMKQFMKYAVSKGVKNKDFGSKKNDIYLEKQIKALIIRNIIGDTGFYLLMNEIDPTFLKALEVIQETKN